MVAVEAKSYGARTPKCLCYSMKYTRTNLLIMELFVAQSHIFRCTVSRSSRKFHPFYGH